MMTFENQTENYMKMLKARLTQLLPKVMRNSRRSYSTADELRLDVEEWAETLADVIISTPLGQIHGVELAHLDRCFRIAKQQHADNDRARDWPLTSFEVVHAWKWLEANELRAKRSIENQLANCRTCENTGVVPKIAGSDEMRPCPVCQPKPARLGYVDNNHVGELR